MLEPLSHLSQRPSHTHHFLGAPSTLFSSRSPLPIKYTQSLGPLLTFLFLALTDLQTQTKLEPSAPLLGPTNHHTHSAQALSSPSPSWPPLTVKHTQHLGPLVTFLFLDFTCRPLHTEHLSPLLTNLFFRPSHTQRSGPLPFEASTDYKTHTALEPSGHLSFLSRPQLTITHKHSTRAPRSLFFSWPRLTLCLSALSHAGE